MKKIITSILLAVVSIGMFAGGKYKHQNAEEFAQTISGGAQIVDVRTPGEFAQGHIPGSVNIEVTSGKFAAMASELLDKDRIVAVYCRSGRRSMTAADILVKQGYTVVNLHGGIIEWKAAGRKVIASSR